MSISYSGITNYGKATLPSVESWGTNMNILRNPTQSITTRRVDRVGQTSSITEMQDISGDRACESILLYARGVNPSVSVAYDNNGIGVQSSGSLVGGNNGGRQAYLPYRINRDGAFRPPLIRQEQLMPLSRQPRINTQAFTKPCFVDFTKKLSIPTPDLREVKNDTLKACVRPTAVYRIETPITEPFGVKYVIKNPIKVGANSGIRTIDTTTQQVQDPTKNINTNPLHANAYANSGSSATVKYADNSDINIERFVQNPLHSSVQSNKYRPVQITPIEDIMDLDIRTKDINNISYTAPMSGNEKDDRLHKDLELQRRVILSTAATNKHRDIYTRTAIEHEKTLTRNTPLTEINLNHGLSKIQTGVDNNSREYNLRPTISAGGYEGTFSKPMLERTQQINENMGSDRSIMSKKVMDMQTGRWAR